MAATDCLDSKRSDTASSSTSVQTTGTSHVSIDHSERTELSEPQGLTIHIHWFFMWLCMVIPIRSINWQSNGQWISHVGLVTYIIVLKLRSDSVAGVLRCHFFAIVCYCAVTVACNHLYSALATTVRNPFTWLYLAFSYGSHTWQRNMDETRWWSSVPLPEKPLDLRDTVTQLIKDITDSTAFYDRINKNWFKTDIGKLLITIGLLLASWLSIFPSAEMVSHIMVCAIVGFLWHTVHTKPIAWSRPILVKVPRIPTPSHQIPTWVLVGLVLPTTVAPIINLLVSMIVECVQNSTLLISLITYYFLSDAPEIRNIRQLVSLPAFGNRYNSWIEHIDRVIKLVRNGCIGLAQLTSPICNHVDHSTPTQQESPIDRSPSVAETSQGFLAVVYPVSTVKSQCELALVVPDLSPPQIIWRRAFTCMSSTVAWYTNCDSEIHHVPSPVEPRISRFGIRSPIWHWDGASRTLFELCRDQYPWIIAVHSFKPNGPTRTCYTFLTSDDSVSQRWVNDAVNGGGWGRRRYKPLVVNMAVHRSDMNKNTWWHVAITVGCHRGVAAGRLVLPILSEEKSIGHVTPQWEILCDNIDAISRILTRVHVYDNRWLIAAVIPIGGAPRTLRAWHARIHVTPKEELSAHPTHAGSVAQTVDSGLDNNSDIGVQPWIPAPRTLELNGRVDALVFEDDTVHTWWTNVDTAAEAGGESEHRRLRVTFNEDCKGESTTATETDSKDNGVKGREHQAVQRQRLMEYTKLISRVRLQTIDGRGQMIQMDHHKLVLPTTYDVAAWASSPMPSPREYSELALVKLYGSVDAVPSYLACWPPHLWDIVVSYWIL